MNLIAVLVCLLVAAAASPVAAATCSSVSNTVKGKTVTFTFDRAYTCGRFANGWDWWVSPDAPGGSVRVTGISPNYSSGRHGAAVNIHPAQGGQPYDDRDSKSYSTTQLATLPLNLSGGSSLIKAVSATGTCDTSGDSTILMYAVLTVLDSPPANDGATVFRPPYVGTSKPLYSTDSIRWGLLPQLDDTGILKRTGHAQVETHFDPPHNVVSTPHRAQKIGMCPYQDGYGGRTGQKYGQQVMDLMYGPIDAQKQRATISLIQAGIDLAHSVRLGNGFDGGGAHGTGRKIIATFAAVMLDEPTLKDPVMNPPNGAKTWHEDAQVQRGKNGVALYGRNTTSKTSKTRWDKFRYIDGAKNYLNCCHWASWTVTGLVLKLMPDLQVVWDDGGKFLEYISRRYNSGMWASPDPAARAGTAWDFNHVHGAGKRFESAASAYNIALARVSWDTFFACAPGCSGADESVSPPPPTVSPPNAPVLLE
jgi:hypothetical protein